MGAALSCGGQEEMSRNGIKKKVEGMVESSMDMSAGTIGTAERDGLLQLIRREESYVADYRSAGRACH